MISLDMYEYNKSMLFECGRCMISPQLVGTYTNRFIEILTPGRSCAQDFKRSRIFYFILIVYPLFLLINTLLNNIDGIQEQMLTMYYCPLLPKAPAWLIALGVGGNWALSLCTLPAVWRPGPYKPFPHVLILYCHWLDPNTATIWTKTCTMG